MVLPERLSQVKPLAERVGSPGAERGSKRGVLHRKGPLTNLTGQQRHNLLRTQGALTSPLRNGLPRPPFNLLEVLPLDSVQRLVDDGVCE